MFRIILFSVFSFCCLSQVTSQAISYEFDTSAMYFVNNLTGDTLLNANNILRSQVDFKFKGSATTGSINIKAQNNPAIDFFDTDDNLNVQISSRLNDSGGGIILSDHTNGKPNVLRLVTNFANSGNARIITDELQINGGSDLAELFEVTNKNAEVVPGLLVSLDPDHPGKLMISNEAYDKKIAGILSGANGVRPGILMGQDETLAFGDELVTLSGRTYVKVNTSNGAIEVGDFITSSKIQGEGMKATSNRKSRGAIIGKAMTSLAMTSEKNGSDYILVLVNLQ